MRVSSPPHRHRERTPLVAGYKVFGFEFAVTSSSPRALELLDALYGGFADPGVAVRPTVPVFRLTCRQADRARCWQVLLDGEVLVSRRSLGWLLVALECEICTRVVANRPDRILLHGAILQARSGAALITGVSGAGKSTLALALAARGHRIGSDDVSLIDPGTGDVHPIPRCFHLDARSRRLLKGLGLQLPRIPARYHFVTPAHLGTVMPMPAVPIRLVFLLRRGDDRSPRLTPLSQAEMTTRLFAETGWGDRSALEMIRALGCFAGRATCYQLTGGRLAEMADLVSGRVEAHL